MSFDDLIPVKVYSAENAYSQMVADARARRERLNVGRPAPVVIPKKRAIETPVPSAVKIAPILKIAAQTIDLPPAQSWLPMSRVIAVPKIAPIAPPIIRSRGGRIRDVAVRVADVFEMRIDVLLSSSRRGECVLPRHVAIWLACRFVTEASLPMIGRAFGGRDHTTIIHARRRIQAIVDGLGVCPVADCIEGWAHLIRREMAVR